MDVLRADLDLEGNGTVDDVGHEKGQLAHEIVVPAYGGEIGAMYRVVDRIGGRDGVGGRINAGPGAVHRG